MKNFFKIIFFIVIALALVIAITIFLDSKFNLLPNYITKIWENSNIDENIGNEDATSDYKYVSSMGEFKFNQYFDLKIPQEFYIPTSEEVNKKYAVFADTVVISDVNVDIIFQLCSIDISDNKEMLNDARTQIVNNLKNKLPDVNFNADNSVTVKKKYIPIVSFMLTCNEQNIYTDIALFEVNGNMMMITLNSSNDYLSTQNLFVSIINTLEIK